MNFQEMAPKPDILCRAPDGRARPDIALDNTPAGFWPTRFSTGLDRLTQHLRRFHQRYPNVWANIDLRRAHRSRWKDWPQWAFLPYDHAQVVLAQDIYPVVSDDVVPCIMLGAWRMSKGVYLFDRELAYALEDTVIKDVPVEVFWHMPERCVYLPFPYTSASAANIDAAKLAENGKLVITPYGCFAQLVEFGDGIPALVLMYDTNCGFIADIFDLVRGHSLERAMAPGDVAIDGHHLYGVKIEMGDKEVARDYGRALAAIDAGETSPGSPRAWKPPHLGPWRNHALKLLTYLCSEEPDIDGTPRGEVQSTKTKRGLRWFPPDKISQWNVGIRLGSKFREAHSLSVEQPSDEAGDRSRERPRPHVRAAHFHHYWTGPRDQPEKRKVVLRFVHETLVNARGSDDLVVTVRPVE